MIYLAQLTRKQKKKELAPREKSSKNNQHNVGPNDISHASPISASLHATSVLLDGTNTHAQNSAQCTLTQAPTYFSFRCITCCDVFPAHATASRSNIFHVIYDLSRLFSLFLILFLFVFAKTFYTSLKITL